jgi:hypothetical protein
MYYNPRTPMAACNQAPAAAEVLAPFVCVLTDSESYSETLEIKPVALQQGTVELVIKTQLRSAKNPAEWRIKSRTCMDSTQLQELQLTIGQFLLAQEGKAKKA